MNKFINGRAWDGVINEKYFPNIVCDLFQRFRASTICLYWFVYEDRIGIGNRYRHIIIEHKPTSLNIRHSHKYCWRISIEYRHRIWNWYSNESNESKELHAVLLFIHIGFGTAKHCLKFWFLLSQYVCAFSNESTCRRANQWLFRRDIYTR